MYYNIITWSIDVFFKYSKEKLYVHKLINHILTDIDQSICLNNISILHNSIHQTKNKLNMTFESNKYNMEIIRSFKECQLQRYKEILNLDK